RPGAGLAALALALALAGGEYGLCAAAYIGAFELVGLARARRSWRGWLPMIAVLVVWAVIHRAYGFGSQGSTVYVDPIREPIAWLSAALVRVPILVADMLLAIPTGKLAFYPDLMRIQAWLGPLALAIVGALVPGVLRRLPGDERRRLAFACLAAMLSLLPVASSFVSARLLLIPGVAGHVVVAALVLDGIAALRDPVRRRAWIGRLRGLAGVALAAVHIGLATYWGLEETISIGELNRGTRTASLTMQIDDSKVADQRLVVLTAADPMTLLYPPIVRWVEGSPMPRSWWVLSMAPRPHRLRRIAADAFELEVVGGAMLKGPVEQLFRRPDQPLTVGQAIELDGLRIEILALADGVHPTRVRYTFDRTLDDPSLVFLLATRRGMLRYPMGPVGATVTIPPAALPLTIPSAHP
ncbi:MAG TPA: hypothetical protein VFG69_19140, partial [Nannocystaceae bacterium]|nr:hypothetical protein [Nannocystaceae bacterium]